MKKFEVIHQQCLRKILRISWNYFVSNAEVQKRSFISLQWMYPSEQLDSEGHVVRMSEERLPGYPLHWIPKHGRMSRLKPCMNWLSCVLEDAAFFTGVASIIMDTTSNR